MTKRIERDTDKAIAELKDLLRRKLNEHGVICGNRACGVCNGAIQDIAAHIVQAIDEFGREGCRSLLNRSATSA